MASPVRMLDVCRSLNLPQTSEFEDAFSVDGALSTNWTAGSWTIQGTASAGAPTISYGGARTGAVEVRDAYVDATAIANGAIADTVAREVNGLVGAGGAMLNNTNVYLFMDMNDTTPNPTTAAISVKAEKAAEGTRALTLWVGALTGSGSATKNLGAPGVMGDTGRVRVSIDSAKTIRVYWSSSSIPDITYTPMGYTAAGGRVGSDLKVETAGVVCSLHDFHFVYTLGAAAVPARTLVSSAGGLLYRETTLQTMVQKAISPLSIESTTRIWAQPHLQDLYIADFVKRIDGAAGVTGTGGADRFDDAAVADWTLHGIDLSDDRLEIDDPADIGTASNISGFYDITAIVGTPGTHLTLSPTPASRTNLRWRVIRAPKKYSLPADAVTVIPIGTVGTSQFPHGCRSFRLWAGRIVACNNDFIPHGWWMSAAGYPLLWDYGDSGTVGANGLTTDNPKLTLGEAAATTDTQAEFAGTIGEPLVTTIPIRDDLLIFAGEGAFYYLRGNPRAGGGMNYIPGPKGVGLVGIGAWVYTPQGRLFVMTMDGLYEVKLEGIIPISRDVIPRELLALSPDRYEVELGYDTERRGFVISCYSATLPYICYFYDLRAEGFFPETRDADQIPSAMVSHRIGDSGIQALLFGCQDGYIRQYSDYVATDDGVAFESYVDYGPIRLGQGETGDGILHEMLDVLDVASGSVTNAIRRGHSAQEANAAEACCTMSSGSGRNRTRYPRVRAGVVYNRTSTSGIRWARESLTITREKVGRLVVP